MKKTLACAATATLLVGCGGGGGGGEPPAPQLTTTNPNAALGAFLRTPKTYQLAGTAANGAAVSATMTVAPGRTTTYQGQTFDLRTVTTATTVGGSTSTASTTYWLQPNGTQMAFAATIEPRWASCDVVSSRADLPATAAMGAAGPYAVARYYTGCTGPDDTGILSVATQTYTWAVKTVSGVPFACLAASLNFVAVTSQETCIEVLNAAGAIGARMRVTVVDGNRNTTVLTTP